MVMLCLIPDGPHHSERSDGIDDRETGQTTHVNPENSRYYCGLHTGHDEQYRQWHRYGCHPARHWKRPEHSCGEPPMDNFCVLPDISSLELISPLPHYVLPFHRHFVASRAASSSYLADLPISTGDGTSSSSVQYGLPSGPLGVVLLLVKSVLMLCAASKVSVQQQLFQPV